MNLYIEIENGQPINHPIYEDNLFQAYVDINLNRDTRFKPFIRIPHPQEFLGNFQVWDSTYITADNGLSYTDSWYIRDMTPEEVTETTNCRIAGINNYIESLLDLAETKLKDVDENNKPIWQNYIDSLNTFTYDDPFTVMIPKPPLVDNKGNLLTGNKPNVIG